MTRSQNPTFTARSLATLLVAIADRHGDLPVFLRDPDTGWLLDTKPVVQQADEDGPLRIDLVSEYHTAP